mmetsp:Transcript_90041/g.280251  ORF Transcript_90041/g.280251 Transcript_90041/m.280251 type:complete len:310 (+) Transcript_90041:158-1087(+)
MQLPMHQLLATVELENADAVGQEETVDAADDLLQGADAAVGPLDLRHEAMARTAAVPSPGIALTQRLHVLPVGLRQLPGHVAQLVIANLAFMNAFREVPVPWIRHALLHHHESDVLRIVRAEAAAGEALPADRDRGARVARVVPRHIVVRRPEIAPAKRARVHGACHQRAPEEVDVIIALHAPMRQGLRELALGQLVGCRPLVPLANVHGAILESPPAERHHRELHHVRPGAGQCQVGRVVIASVVRVVEVLHAEELAHDAVRLVELVVDETGASHLQRLVDEEAENVVQALKALAIGLLLPVVQEHPA